MENARSNGPPWQSRLIPYEEEILELRRRRPPMPFDQITTFGYRAQLREDSAGAVSGKFAKAISRHNRRPESAGIDSASREVRVGQPS
jgi:hypothetical protein